jgi:formamidopyrimidine-DNA glycosylase
MTEGAQYKHFSEVLQCIKGKRLLRVRRAIRALAAALDPLLGRRVIRVLSVGKEIFFVFEQLKRPGQEDQALKIHFGDGPGYQYESAAGEVWGMVKKPSRRQPVAETELEFEGCLFRLWEDHNFYSHLYSVVDFGYVHTVESRRHRDIATDNFSNWTSEVVSLLRQRDGYIVDWIMDQTIMPGVGNIMKSEGLFNAGVHPLRKCKSLTNEELRKVVEELNCFALIWYHLCKRTGEGAPRVATDSSADNSEQVLPKKCYGEVYCTRCGDEVLCIKLGARQRITYFCNHCQPPDAKHRPYWRQHKSETPLQVPLCSCNMPAIMRHVYHYGHDHGKVFFACRKPQSNSSRCRFRAYLDSQNFIMPMCHCQPAERMVLRRVMGLVDNGRYFAQCSKKRCKYRVWIALTLDSISSSAKPLMPEDGSEGQRWNRHKKRSMRTEQQKENSESSSKLFVRRSVNGEFVHGRQGMAQLGKHLLSIPDSKGVVQSPADIGPEESCGSGSCTPVTSGAEELLDDEAESNECPPDLTQIFEKRWGRKISRQSSPATDAVEGDQHGDSTVAVKCTIMDLFPSACPILVDELLLEDMTLEQIVDCLSTLDIQGTAA